MASAATPALAAAVSNAGGLGSLGSATLSVEKFREQVEAVRAGSNRPFDANFFVHDDPVPDAAAETAMQDRLAPYYAEMELGDVPAVRQIFPIFGEDMLEAVTTLRPPVVSFHFGLPERGVVEKVKEAGAIILASAPMACRSAPLFLSARKRRCIRCTANGYCKLRAKRLG